MQTEVFEFIITGAEDAETVARCNRRWQESIQQDLWWQRILGRLEGAAYLEFYDSVIMPHFAETLGGDDR